MNHAIHWAAVQGSLDVLEFLLAQGANPDANDPDPKFKKLLDKLLNIAEEE